MEKFITTPKVVMRTTIIGDLHLELSNYGLDVYKLIPNGNGTSNRINICFFSDVNKLINFIVRLV